METLKDVLPYEFMRGEYTDTRAYQFRDVEVVKEHRLCSAKWPGQHKHVCSWYELANGYAVGWNENPSKGWSFPVIKFSSQDK